MNEKTLPSDTELEIRALTVWGRARYLSVTKALHKIKSFQVWAGKKQFFFKLEGGSVVRTCDLRLSKQRSITTLLVHQGSRPNTLKALILIILII